MTDKTTNNRTKTIFGITLVMLLILCAVSAVKRIFVGLDVDEEYAVALAYRIANGDILIKEMWEPHMLSGLFLAPPVWLFVTIRKNTEFIIVALRIYGVLVQSVVCFAWYRVFCKRTSPFATLASAMLIFYTLPKFIQTPEFANVQIWFLLLTGLCILAADEGRRKGFYLLAGVCYVFELLTYPTLIILLPLYLILLGKKGGILRFLAPLLTFGLGAVLYVLKFVGFKTARSNISYILSDDSHAGGMGAKLSGYAGELPAIVLHLVIYAAIAMAISALIILLTKSKIRSRGFVILTTALFAAVAFLDQLRFWLVLQMPNVHPQYRYAALFVAAIVLYCSMREEIRLKWSESFGVFVIGSFLAVLAILSLTNLDVKATLVHLLPAGLFWLSAVGAECKGYPDKEKNSRVAVGAVTVIAVAILLAVNCFGQTYLVRVNNEGLYEDVFFSAGGKRLSFHGPSHRIYCGYWDGEEKNANYDLITNTIPNGSRVLYVGTGNTLYLIGNSEICVPSVISTPVFNQKTIDYFSLNPQKTPEYIVVENSGIDEEGHLKENRFVSKEFIAWIDKLCGDEKIAANDFVTIFKTIDE